MLQERFRKSQSFVLMAHPICGLFLLICMAGFIVGCKKEQKEPELTRRDKILGSWRRTLRARDANNNHIIDSAEIVYAPATDTLFLALATDATFTRTLMFKGVAFPVTGTWHMQREDIDLVLQPTTSTSRIDTCTLDTLSQAYFRYHQLDSANVWNWEAFSRPQ